MSIDNISKKITNLSQRIEKLQLECASDPVNASEVLYDTLKELQFSLKEFAATDSELRQQNEELTKTKEALNESEQRFRDAIDHFPNVFAIYDANRKVMYVNTKGLQILGLSEENVIGRKDEEIFPPEMINSYVPALDRAIKTKMPQMLERTRPARLGAQTIIVNIIPRIDKYGEIRQIFGVTYDVTELKHVENELRKSEERLQNLIKYAPAGIHEMSLNGTRFLSVNDRVCRSLGYSREELLSMNPIDLMGDENRKLFEERIKNVLAGEKIEEDVEYSIKTKSGKTRYASLNVCLSYNKGEPESVFVISQDTTDRKQMEEELERKIQERTVELQSAKENLEVVNEELRLEIKEHERTEKELFVAKETAEEALRAKATFLANMSHELRTPMNAVIGFSSLLLDDNLTQEQKEYIQSIRNGGEALLAIISDILEFSRAEKEKITLEHQPLNLKRCIEESLDMVTVQAKQKGLNLAYIVSYGTPDTIIGDPGLIRRILVNLLSNAVKFTDKGNISVSFFSNALESNKHLITFTVKDTGIGIPQDKMDSLFKPFTQLEHIISRKRDGIGLGLAICKRLVELMGGEIWAESEEGKGSTFWFTIQAEAVSCKQPDLEEIGRGAAYENPPGQKPLSILVAEDNPSNQRVLVEMLKRMGYRPDAVADGKEVLQALKIRSYDLILMDIRMPKMDGMTASKEIRKLWPYNGPKIVAVTAFAMEGDREKCLEAGMDDYIAKPVKLDDLAKLLFNTSEHSHKLTSSCYQK